MAVLLVWDLVFDVLGVVRGIVPAARVVPSLLYAFGACTVAIFFYVYQRRA